MLTSMTFLDLSNNRLTGSIPSVMWEMPSLSTLLLESNMLNTSLPSSFPESRLGKQFHRFLNLCSFTCIVSHRHVSSSSEIVGLSGNDGITGDASDICSSSNHLTTFSYSCDLVSCSGPCCHSECCSPSASNDCFSVLISSSVEAKNDGAVRVYQANRTISDFSPSIIRHH